MATWTIRPVSPTLRAQSSASFSSRLPNFPWHLPSKQTRYWDIAQNLTAPPGPPDPEGLDGREALLVNGGCFDGGAGAFFVNAGDDLHAVGSLDPLIPGHVGCIVIRPDGGRALAHVEPDPLATQSPSS